MSQLRNTDGRGAARPLSARSIIASTLLGIDPPEMPARLLVRSGELFGIAEGTTRTAISRMVAAGELAATDGSYRLAGPLLARQARQRASRAAERGAYDGRWELAVVEAERRSAAERHELREAMRQLKLASLREGVWLRPANLAAARSPDARSVTDRQCRWLRTDEPDDAAGLVARLWDLDAWAGGAADLLREFGELGPRLERGDTAALAPGFVVSASALRHMLADPLLPAELLPAGWPGDQLRATYNGYDRAFARVWFDWFDRQAP